MRVEVTVGQLVQEVTSEGLLFLHPPPPSSPLTSDCVCGRDCKCQRVPDQCGVQGGRPHWPTLVDDQESEAELNLRAECR